MPPVINPKICDRGRGCPCIAACPKNAWYFDEEKNIPAIDISKCDNCGICIKACPARAVFFAYSKEGLVELEKQFKKDPRRSEKIMEERYNADPIDPKTIVNSENFDKEVLDSDTPVLVEFWADKYASRCRIGAPLYSEILSSKNIKIRKINLEENPDIASRYKVSAVPSILIFNKGKVVDCIVGCQSVADKEILKEILSKSGLDGL